MSHTSQRSELEHKILGCLYGQAIGDAFGMPSELWTKNQISRYFGWLDDFLPGPAENIAANEFKAGEFTDDTSQCIALMDSIIENNGDINADSIAEHIIKWATRINAFDKNILGPTSKAALTSIINGQPLADIEANGITNGSAMRVAPMGCLMPTNNVSDFVEAVRISCLPTHKSDIAIAGAVVISWAISRAIEGATWQQIKDEIIPLANNTQRDHESTFSPLLGHRIRYALHVVDGQKDNNKALTDLYEIVGSGMDIIESVPAAIALVEISGTNPMLCAELAANLGGDTDTIGAMATAICGALHGIDAFQAKHIVLINSVNNINFNPYAKALTTFRLNRTQQQG